MTWMQTTFYAFPDRVIAPQALPLPCWPLSTLFGAAFALACLAILAHGPSRRFKTGLRWLTGIGGTVGTIGLICGSALPDAARIPVFVGSCLLAGITLSGMIVLWGAIASHLKSGSAEIVIPLSFLGASLLSLLILSAAPTITLPLTASFPLLSSLCAAPAPSSEDGTHSLGQWGLDARKGTFGICLFLLGLWLAYAFLKFAAYEVSPASLSAGRIGFIAISLVALLLLFGSLRVSRNLDLDHAAAIAVPLMCFACAFASRGVDRLPLALMAATLSFTFGYLFIWLVLTKVAQRLAIDSWALFACFTLATSLGISLGYGLSEAARILPRQSASAPLDWLPFILAASITLIFASLPLARNAFARRRPASPAPITPGNGDDNSNGDGESFPTQLIALTYRNVAPLAQKYGLAPREHEVLAYLMAGSSRADIRDALGISINTVNTHLRRIYDKTGLHGKKELQAGIDELNRESSPL